MNLGGVYVGLRWHVGGFPVGWRLCLHLAVSPRAVPAVAAEGRRRLLIRLLLLLIVRLMMTPNHRVGRRGWRLSEKLIPLLINNMERRTGARNKDVPTA